MSQSGYVHVHVDRVVKVTDNAGTTATSGGATLTVTGGGGGGNTQRPHGRGSA